MSSLAKSIGTIIFVLVMATIVTDRISETFPHIDTVGWIIVVIFFGTVITLAITTEPLIVRTNWHWVNRNEELRQYVILIVVAALLLLSMYAAWPVIGEYVAPHFGASQL